MGILINTGFDVGSSSPIDSRTFKETVDERNALVSEGKVYENLKVYCKDTKKEYRWTGTEWETVDSSSGGTAIDDTQASDTTTYSSNKITDLITEATAGKDLGNLLIVDNASEMSTLATKDNLGKSVLYVGDDTSSYTKGEIYELYWNAITINYLNFVYSPTVKFDFKRIQEILGSRTSLTVTGEYGYRGQSSWNITTNIGMSGGGLSLYGISVVPSMVTMGDKFKYTYNKSNKNRYTWIPIGNRPTRNLTKAWYNIDRPIMYSGTDGMYKKGRVYRLTGDKVEVSTNSTEISNLVVDKNKFLNNTNLRGEIIFKWNSSGGYFKKLQDGAGDANKYTKEQLNNWGITYDGDITINDNYIRIVTSKHTSLDNWEWKDVTEVPTKTSELTNDSNYVTEETVNTGLNNKVNKTDITTTINSTSTDEQVPSARIVVDELGLKANKMVMKPSQNVDDLVDEGSYYVLEARNAPDGYGWIDVLANNNYTIQLFYPSITANCEMYIRRRQAGGAWSPWKRLCTTTVADVPKTSVATQNVTGSVSYAVKNGVCYVVVSIVVPTDFTAGSIIVPTNSLPKYNTDCSNGHHPLYKGGLFVVEVDGSARLWDVIGQNVYGSFSYPVAE